MLPRTAALCSSGKGLTVLAIGPTLELPFARLGIQVVSSEARSGVRPADPLDDDTVSPLPYTYYQMDAKVPHTTRPLYAVWIALFIFAVLLALAVKYWAFFPGDVAVERWVQSLVPQDLNWAKAISRTAEFPWLLLILALVLSLSWVLPDGPPRFFPS